MAPEHNFEYLPLVLRRLGPARFPQAPVPVNPITDANRRNRAAHLQTLGSGAAAVTAAWKNQQDARAAAGSPIMEAGIPLLLKIDTSLDLDDLRKTFNFEIVSEQEDGFVIVASEDIALPDFQQKLQDFGSNIRGSANVARVHELRADPRERLQRILSESLLKDWDAIRDADDYIIDIGVACTGNWQIPNRPSRGRRTEQTWARVEAEWSQKRIEAYEQWDELREQRAAEITGIVRAYNAEVIGDFHNDPADAVALPDSFTLRLRLSGLALKDLVLNYSFIFDVAEPDDIETPQQRRREYAALAAQLGVRGPNEHAPTVCVIDSGIQEEHIWLEPGIHKQSSRCFLKGSPANDVSDYVAGGGHGTRVAGAVLYGEEIPKDGEVNLEYWVQNARVLDNNNDLPKSMMPAAVLQEVITNYFEGPQQTRIFNHSINGRSPCRLRHMSSWAAEIDALSYTHDVLVIQSAGNINDSGPAPLLGIAEFIQNGQAYPDYLSQGSCRIANPAQSLQALTVGSVAYGKYEDLDWRSFATDAEASSGFSRCGLGIWDSIKPEVVEFGGDLLYSTGNPPALGTPDVAAQCYPELVRSTLNGGPAVARDSVGTSYAAPKVTRIAARMQSILPNASCLLYRALIVQSALWPNWAGNLTVAQKTALLKRIGYGLPDIERATVNTDHRTTLITQQDNEIAPGDCHVFQVPIPEELRAPGDDYDIKIEVTLSYVSEPRRTRRTHRGYLAVWMEWLSSRRGESLEAFLTRALKVESEPINEGTSIRWTIGSRNDWGALQGVHRNAGTVQKDWAILKSNALPENFCIAVRAHRGWTRDPDAAATYALAVTFEIMGREIPIYEPLRTAVLELQSELQAEAEEEVAIEIEG